MRNDVILTGLQVPEGPAMLSAGRIVFTEQTRGAVSLCTEGVHELLAVTGGAPNSAVVGSDDAIYVCQNGGVVGAWRSATPQTPGIQRIGADGVPQLIASTVRGIELVTPNDLAFGPDGRLYFTDPAQPFDPQDRRDTGKIFALGESGSDQVVAHAGPVYCNGLAFTAGGTLIWVESYTRRVVLLGAAGRASVLSTLTEGHVPDGIAVAEDGRIYIATCGSHGVDVIGPDGSDQGFLMLDDQAYASNLCFDGSALWVTDFGIDHADIERTGRLWRLETDATGLVPHRGTLSAREPAQTGDDQTGNARTEEPR